jgi:hypothetical protein
MGLHVTYQCADSVGVRSSTRSTKPYVSSTYVCNDAPLKATCDKACSPVEKRRSDAQKSASDACDGSGHDVADVDASGNNDDDVEDDNEDDDVMDDVAADDDERCLLRCRLPNNSTTAGVSSAA